MSIIIFYSTRMKKKPNKKCEIFFQIFFWSPGSRIVPKNVKGTSKKPNYPLSQVPVEVVWHLVLVQVSL